MDLQQRLKQFETMHDWQGLLEALEQAIGEETQPSAKAKLHLRLGRLLESRFLMSARALKHFQRAFKLQPDMLAALDDASRVYLWLGKVNMVQKLIDLRLKQELEDATRSSLLVQLGDILVDGGSYEEAASAYAQAVAAAKGKNPDASVALEDVQLNDTSWQEYIANVLRDAHATDDPTQKGRLFLRAARIAARFAPEEREGLLQQAYKAAPFDTHTGLLYEGVLQEHNRLDDLATFQAQLLEATEDAHRFADLAFAFGARWGIHHKDLARGASFVLQAFDKDPENEAAYLFLAEALGNASSEWDRVAALAEGALARLPQPPARVFYLAQYGEVTWKHLGNLLQAKQTFTELKSLAAGHRLVGAFEVQLGEQLPTDAAERLPAATNEASPTPAVSPAEEEKQPEAQPVGQQPEEQLVAEQPTAETDRETATIAADDVQADDETEEAPEAQVDEPPAASDEPTDEDLARIQTLREAAVKQEQAKRYNEFVRTLIALADLVPNTAEKIDLYERAADLFVNKFSNQAEAIKAYAKVLEYDPENRKAIEYLLPMYERRRDWENLIKLRQHEADRLDDPFERVQQYTEIAQLATKRLRKPDLCVGLWDVVLEADPTNTTALASLAQLHEHARNYAELAQVLQRQADVTTDPKQRLQLLTKLGMICGDRLKDDEAAVAAWTQVLELKPGDRRAQEQLRKKYIALRRWDSLEEFYAGTGRWDEFIRVLDSQEDKEPEIAAKISLLMKVAALWRDKKNKLDRAARSLEKVLTLDENYLPAAEALIPIYEQANNAKGLAKAIEVKLNHEQDDFERLELLRRVADLYENRVKDPNKACDRYLQALEIAPSDEECRSDAERLAQQTERWDDLVAAYRRTIQAAEERQDADQAIALRLTLGRVLIDEVNNIDDALIEFRNVYDQDDTNEEAITALEQLYRRAQRFDDLLSIYNHRKTLAVDFDAKRDALAQIATLYETETQQPDKAIETYNEVLEDDPTHIPTLQALDRLYAAQQDWPNHAEVLRRLIELDVDNDTLIDLKFRLGATLDGHLSEPVEALQNYREILVLDPSHEPARVALEQMLGKDDLRAEAAAILDPIYEALGEPEKLVGVLEVLAAAEQDVSQRVEILRRISSVAADLLEDPNAAFDALARAVRDEPVDDQSREDLERLAEQSNRWAGLEELYSHIAQSTDDAVLARDYWIRLGGIEERLNKPTEAASAYHQVLDLDPSDDQALAALDSLYRRTESWPQLLDIFRRRIELTDDLSEREQYYAQIAQVSEDMLGRHEDAIAAYREVLTQDDTSQLALTALDGLFSRHEMWQELADNLEAQLRLVETDEAQTQLMLRLAGLREAQMGQPDGAVAIYRDVLLQDATNEQALAALERLGQQAEHELEIAEILEPLYRQAGDYQKLIGVHEVQVRRSDDPLRRVELLHEIATLHEDAAGDVDAAFDTVIRALQDDPAHEDSQAQADRLASATDRYGDLAAAYVSFAEKQEDTALAADLFGKAAQIFNEQLNLIDQAVTYYRRVLGLDEENLDAAEALERLFRDTERYADLSQILQSKARIIDDPYDTKEALFQAATIEEELLSRPEEAIAVYLKILEEDPDEVRAVDALINRYLDLERWPDLLDAYTKKADLVFEPDEKKLIYYQMGSVYERELQDVAHAIDTYQRVLELDPDDGQALGRLDMLYQTSEAWPELLSVLQHEAELAKDESEAISFQYRIAELYEKRLEDVPRAVELYRDLLYQDPGHAPTLQALEALKSEGPDALSAATVLEPIYDDAADWQKLIGVLEVQAAHQEDPYQKNDLLHRIARLHQDNLQDLNAAFDAYSRALVVDNTNQDTLEALEALASITERWGDLTKLYDQELDKLEENPDWLADLSLRNAAIYETNLENYDEAIAHYRKVLTLQPENEQALTSLDNLFYQLERWGDLAQVLTMEAEVSPDPEAMLTFRYRLGEVYQQQLSDVDSAIQAYREVLLELPSHEGSIAALEGMFAQGIQQPTIAEILEPLYTDNGEWEKLAGVYEAQLAAEQDPVERLAMYHRIAELYEGNLLTPEQALNVYVRAIREFPQDERVGEEIERLAQDVEGGWEILGNAYADVLETNEDAAVKCEIGKRHARVFEEQLAQIDNAITTYNYVLQVVPEDLEVLAELDRIYEAMEHWAELAQILERRVRLIEDDIELVDLYARLGQVYEVHLQQYDDAIRVYRKLFDELDPTHDEALDALERLYEFKQAWPQLNEVYERRLDNAMGDMEEADIRAKMANVSSERLGEIDQAVDIWKRVLDLRGEDTEALDALARLYEHREQWAELTDVLERQYDIAETDESRIDLLLRRALVFLQQLNRSEEALEDYQRVLDIDYANLDSLRAIASIWRDRDEPTDLVEALHNMVDRAGSDMDIEELKQAYRELGNLYGTRLEQPFDAADAWSKLLEVDPSDMEALDALEKIYRADERLTDVVTVKMQRAEALPEPEEKIRELLEVTEIWQDQLESPDDATQAYERILGVDPAHEQAFLALEKLHTAAERWEPLIELYLNRFETREEVGQRTELLRKIARVFEVHLGDKGQAFDALLQAFLEDYSDRETADYLGKMAHASNQWRELLEEANRRLMEEKDTPKIIQLCLHLAKWYGEDLGNAKYAQPYFQKIMQLDPSNVAVMRQMASLHRKNQQWRELGRMLTEALKHATTARDRKEIQTDLGELLEKQMDEPDKGIVYYKNALEVDPYHLPALEALERIYTERQMPTELAEILSAKVIAEKDNPEQAAELNVRLGTLYETTLGDLSKATDTYKAALELEPSNLPAMKGLERVYQALSNWTDMVSVLEQQLDVVTTQRERIEALLKLATIYEEQFLQADEASKRFEQILDIDPDQEPALVGLERCYSKLRQWLNLVNAYERHIDVTLDRNLKIELYGYIALVYGDEVGDVDLAIDAYQNIIEIDDANIPALEALAKLYEKKDSPSDSIDYMTRVAELTADGAQRVEMYYRIGRAYDTKLDDRMSAREQYEMALDLDPTHLPTLASLREIALESAEYDQAARYLDQEQQYTQAARQRSKLLVDLGALRDEQLGEHEEAIQAYEQALEVDPENDDAARPLLDEYVEQEQWEKSAPLAEMLLKKASKMERYEQHALYRTLGRIESELGHNEQALEAYKEAHHLDMTDQETIRGLADVSFKLEDWASSLSNYQKVLTSLQEDEYEERANVYYKLGCIKRKQGQVRQATNNFEKALAIDDAHRATLEAMVEVYQDVGDWKQVCAYKSQILDNIFEDDERFVLLRELATIWEEKEQNWTKAIEVNEEALQLKPENHILLHDMLRLYNKVKNYEAMVDTIQAIIGLEPNPERKARYLFTAAQLYRDMDDLDRAVEMFNESLDLNPDSLDAFERINKILTSKKDWKKLERSYRKMIYRIAGKNKPDLEYQLWHQLGVVFRDRLSDMNGAIEAFKMASRFRPDDITERQILAELYEATDQIDQAIDEQQHILHQDPTQVPPYRALYGLYYKKQSTDEAWCTCAALSFMQRADDSQSQFFEQYKPKTLQAANSRSRLDNEMWRKHVFHSDEDLQTGLVFEMLTHAALTARIQQLQATNQLPRLDNKYREDPHTTTVTFAKTFFAVSRLLGITPPQLYVHSKVGGGLKALTVMPPSSMAGSSVLSGFSPQQLAFMAGKHLATYRPEHYIKTIFATQSELTQLFFAALRMVLPDAPVPPQFLANADGTAKVLAPFMQPQHREGLHHVAKKFVEAKGVVNIKRWLRATEFTACRSGFIACGDLEVSKQVLLLEPEVPGGVSVKDKLSDLLSFSVSDDYFAVRKALGVTIG